MSIGVAANRVFVTNSRHATNAIGRIKAHAFDLPQYWALVIGIFIIKLYIIEPDRGRGVTTNADNRFDWSVFIARHGGGFVSRYGSHRTVYSQGDPADTLFFIVRGSVKVTITSELGKEAVLAILTVGDFFGEGCLDGHPLRTSAVVATEDSEIARFDAALIKRALGSDPTFATIFVTFLLDRNERLKADLAAQLIDSSEKRLARTLLLLAHTEKNDQSNFISTAIDQQTLAQMVGTTRSHISTFMNKFRKLGYVDYNGSGGIKVHNSLLSLVLHEPERHERKPEVRSSPDAPSDRNNRAET